MLKKLVLYSKMPPLHWKLGWNTKQHLSPWKSSPNVVNATCQLLASVINATCPLAYRVVNTTCQLSTCVDLDTLNLARSFEKGLRIGPILDILDGKFEESAIWIIPSYPLHYHLSPTSTIHFMEKGKRNLEIWEQSYVVGLRIEARRIKERLHSTNHL